MVNSGLCETARGLFSCASLRVNPFNFQIGRPWAFGVFKMQAQNFFGHKNLNPRFSVQFGATYYNPFTFRVSYGDIKGDSNFWACGWNPMVWPFTWNLFSSTFEWCYLYLNILRYENIWYFSSILILGILGSERVKMLKTKKTH